MTNAVPKKKKYRKKKVKKFTYKDVLADIFPVRNDKPLEAVRKCIFLVLVAVFSCCLFYIAEYYKDNKENSDFYGQISNEYLDISDDNPAVNPNDYVPAEGDPEWKVPLVLLPAAEKMLKENPEYMGFLSIEGTKVQYPVVQHKADYDNVNAYYLTHSFDNSLNRAGSIYFDRRVNFDVEENGFRSVPNSSILLIHGHEMKDGQMFGSLKSYKDNYSYYGKHPIINLDSKYYHYKFKIFAVCVVDTEETKPEYVFNYYNTIELPTEAEFYDYVNNCKKRSYVLNDVDVKYGDQLLTLSTCNGMTPEARLFVVARLLREGEDELEGTQNSSHNKNALQPSAWYKYNGGSYNPDLFVPFG